MLAALTDAVHAALPELERLSRGWRATDSLRPRGAGGAHGGGGARGLSDERTWWTCAARVTPMLLAQPCGAPRAFGGSRGSPPRRRAPLSSSRGRTRGQDGGAQDPGPLAVMAAGRNHVPAQPARGCRVYSSSSPSSGTTERGRRISPPLRFVKQIRGGDRAQWPPAPVLPNELGGHGPDDGAALAQAVLESRRAGALCAASTT